jgi:hypothetical protein
MDSYENKIKELTENIVESIVSLSLGKEPNFLSNSVYKSIANHPNFLQIRQLVVEHLQNFDGKIETAEEWKKLNDFRFNLIELYNTK